MSYKNYVFVRNAVSEKYINHDVFDKMFVMFHCDHIVHGVGAVHGFSVATHHTFAYVVVLLAS